MKSNLNDREAIKKLDDCHQYFESSEEVQVMWVNPQELLTVQRFDLYAIIFYIDCYVKGVDLDFATRIYKDRTRIVTQGTFSEVGNNKKNNFTDFLDTLNDLIVTFQSDKFESSRSRVPVDKNMTVLDGAHRVACSIFFDKKIEIVKFQKRTANFDLSATTMKKLGYLPEHVDFTATLIPRWKVGVYALIVWPKALNSKSKYDEVRKNLSEEKVYYSKKLKISFQGGKNLMLQLYGHMDWVGKLIDNFRNIDEKLRQVYASHGQIEVILISSKSLEHVVNLKQKIRSELGIGLSSIHSTDNKRETIIALDSLCNTNSINFLNKANPLRFKETLKNVYSQYCHDKNWSSNSDHVLISGGSVLAINGLRESNDIDFITTNYGILEKFPGFKEVDFDEHNYLFEKMNINVDQQILDPKNYFSFLGIKFLSLTSLSVFKKIRNEKKDRLDVVLMAQILKSNKTSIWKNILIYQTSVLSNKIRINLHKLTLQTLKLLKIYSIVQYVYRKMIK